MNDVKQENEMLDRLLGGLGTAPVDDGFAQRVVRGVEARTAAAEPRAPRRPLVWCGFAAAAAIFLCAIAVHEARHRRDATQAAQNQATPLPLVIVPDKRDEAAVEPPAPRPTVPLRHETVSADAQPAIAALVSFPAPEAPLTDQERLMLRIVHRGDPVEMAMLNPQELDREEAAEAAEFQQFFPPPPKPDNVDPDNPTKEKEIQNEK